MGQVSSWGSRIQPCSVLGCTVLHHVAPEAWDVVPIPANWKGGRELRRGESLSSTFCCACCLQGPAGETELDGTSGALPRRTSSWVCLRHHSPNQPKLHESVHFFSVWFPARICIPSPNLNQDRCSTQYILSWYHLHLTCPAPCVDCPPLLQQIPLA